MKKIFVLVLLAVVYSTAGMSQEVATDSVSNFRSYRYRVDWQRVYSTNLTFEETKARLIEQMEDKGDIVFLQSSNERIIRAKFNRTNLAQKDVLIAQTRSFLTATIKIELLDGSYKVKITNAVFNAETGALAGSQEYTFEQMFLKNNSGSFYKIGMPKLVRFYEDFFDGVFVLKTQ